MVSDAGEIPRDEYLGPAELWSLEKSSPSLVLQIDQNLAMSQMVVGTNGYTFRKCCPWHDNDKNKGAIMSNHKYDSQALYLSFPAAGSLIVAAQSSNWS